MEKAFFLLNWSLFQSRSETARLLVCAVVKNEPMGRQRSCTNLWRRFPPDPAKMGGESGYISSRFAIGSSDFFSFSDDDFVYTDPEAYSPLTRLAAGPSDLDLLGWSAFSTRPSIAAVLVPFAAAIRRFSHKFLKEQIGVLMPRRYCGSCRSPLHADDGHSECVSCFGKSHADATLAGSDCSHCESISLASLRSWIAFFSESDPTPRALPFYSSQGPVRKKQRGRGSQRPVESELTPAQIPRVSLSPHREVSPVLFFQPDQHPSASASDLVSFGGSDDELANDSMSLAASDAEELSGSITDPAPHVCPRPAPPKPGWMPNFSVSSQKRLKSWVWSGLHQRSPLAAVWMSGFCRGAVRPLSNDHRRSSLKFTTSSRDLGAPLTLPASVLSASSALTTIGRRWRKGIWEDASTGWVSGCTSLPTHCHRLEGEGQSPVQAMQDHFSAR